VFNIRERNVKMTRLSWNSRNTLASVNYFANRHSKSCIKSGHNFLRNISFLYTKTGKTVSHHLLIRWLRFFIWRARCFTTTCTHIITKRKPDSTRNHSNLWSISELFSFFTAVLLIKYSFHWIELGKLVVYDIYSVTV